MKYYEIIGEKIRRARIEKNITQEDLGRSINADKQTISKIEKGKRKLYYEEFKLIEDFLGKDQKYFEDIDEFIYDPSNKTIKFIINRLSHFKKWHIQEQVNIEEAVKFIRNYFKKQNIGSFEISDIAYALAKKIDLKEIYNNLKIVNNYLYKKGLTKKDISDLWDTF